MDAVDAHVHIIDPRYPLTPNDGYLPQPFDISQYRSATKRLRDGADLAVTGGVIVSGSFQAFDTTYLVDALTQLGPAFAGVVNLPFDADDASTEQLDAAGVRAIRCNLYRGAGTDLADVEALARRVHDLVGWHTEFYLDGADLAQLMPLLTSLPQITIDHFGMSDAPGDELVALARGGAVIKATGLGRTHVSDPGRLLRRLLDVSPRSMVFGTDLPSTRARTPFSAADVTRIREWAGDDAPAVFADNARRLYRLPRRTSKTPGAGSYASTKPGPAH